MKKFKMRIENIEDVLRDQVKLLEEKQITSEEFMKTLIDLNIIQDVKEIKNETN